MNQRSDPTSEHPAAHPEREDSSEPQAAAAVGVEPGGASAGDVEAGVQALQQTLSEGENRYLRLAADFENFRRRKEQELIDNRRYASEEAAMALLPVLDNLRRAVDHAPEAGADERFLNGLTLVVREFGAALERIGVTTVPGAGEAFDPAVHEAVAGEEADVDRDTVVDVLLPGYRLHDRLLRPALVRVAHPRHAEPAG